MATAALVVSIIALGWQVLSWTATQRPRVRILLKRAQTTPQTTSFVTYDEDGDAWARPTEGTMRRCLLVSVLNRGVNPFEVTAVHFQPAEGGRGGIGIAGLPVPDPSQGIPPTIPGLVGGHSQGLAWAMAGDLERAMGADGIVQVRIDLGNGTFRLSDPFALADPRGAGPGAPSPR